MNFIQRPSGVNFAGNICDIIIESTVPQSFTLSVQKGGGVLKERYHPVDGRITVPLRDIMQRVAVAASIEPGVVDLPTYQYQFGGVIFGTFSCINGGVEAEVAALGFIENNWLTWQQQTRRTTFHAPQRLCYVVLAEPAAYLVKVRGYFSDSTHSEITLTTITQRGINTLDVTYGAISGRFQQQIVAFDVWVEVRAGVKSYTQRYILVDEIYSADYFMWINSLGGVDTAIFTGELKEDNKYQTNSMLTGGQESEYNTKVRKAFTKYTGYIGNNNERLWILDFFNSTTRWHLDQGALKRITVSSPKLEHTRGELMGYEFTFSHSKQSRYLNIARVEIPKLLEITNPSGELFFLAPRLLQFKIAEVSSAEILFPVQYPHSKEWLQLTLTQIIQLAAAGGGGGQVGKHAASHAKNGSDPVIPYAIGAADINGSADEDFSAKGVTAGSIQTPGAREGLVSGKGAIIKTLENGDTILEIDYGIFRKGIKASKLTISEVEFVGGIELQGTAKMQIDKVVDLTIKPTDDPQYRANTLRLYFDNKDGKINNHFKVGCFALSKSVNADSPTFEIVHSWRVVKEVGVDYIDVYKFNVNTFEKEDLDRPGTIITVNREVDSGSGIPREGDVVGACGHLSDVNYMGYSVSQSIGINAPIREEWGYVNDFRPSAAANRVFYSDSTRTERKGDNFMWTTRKGVKPLMLPPEVWIEGSVASYPESYIFEGSTFVCMGSNITDAPSDTSEHWLRTGGKGSKGDRFGQVYMWTGEAQSPSKPVGRTLAAVAAEGWVESNARRRVIVNKATGRPLARRMADGTVRVLTAGLPKHYRLYVVNGELTADGGELVGEWSEPLLCVEQSVIDGLNSDIDTADKKATDAKTTAEQAKLDAEQKANNARIDALATLFPAGTDKATLEAILKRTGNAPLSIDATDPNNALVVASNLYAEKLAANKAFINNLAVQEFKATKATVMRLDTRIDGKGVGCVLQPQGTYALMGYNAIGENTVQLVVDGVSGRPEFYLASKVADRFSRMMLDKIQFQNLGGAYVNAEFGLERVTLPSEAEVDIPCVALAGYGVLSNGVIRYRFGAKKDATGFADKPPGTTGVYTVPHQIGHTHYNIQVTVQAPAGEKFYGWNEVRNSRTNTSVQIKIAELAVGAANADFTITFFGKN